MTDEKTQAAPTHPAQWSPPRKSPWVVVSIVVLAVLAIAAIALAFRLPPFGRNPDTDDAYVRGHTTVIAPQVSGYVSKVLVDDYQWVRAGDPLVQIDDSTYRAKVDQA